MLAAAVLMAGMTFSPMGVPQANAQISFHLGWQQPPQEYNDIQRQGFQAGIRAGRADLDHSLAPDPDRHGEFQRPRVPDEQRNDFRRGFQHGYEVAYQHRDSGDWNQEHHDGDAGVPRAYAPNDIHPGWQQPPQEYNDIQRQGFQAGLEAGRQDLQQRQSADPQRHWDFRRPHVPDEQRNDFRRGFQHGYDIAYQHRGDWDHDHHDGYDHPQ